MRRRDASGCSWQNAVLAARLARRHVLDVAHVHVAAEAGAVDDDHADDLWWVPRQAVTPDRYDEVRAKATQTLDAIVAFIDGFLARIG